MIRFIFCGAGWGQYKLVFCFAVSRRTTMVKPAQGNARNLFHLPLYCERRFSSLFPIPCKHGRGKAAFRTICGYSRV
jgi:hypothetical protein